MLNKPKNTLKSIIILSFLAVLTVPTTVHAKPISIVSLLSSNNINLFNLIFSKDNWTKNKVSDEEMAKIRENTEKAARIDAYFEAREMPLAGYVHPLTLDHTVLRLGHAGLIPFVLLSLLLWLVTPALHPFVAIALTGYAATVVAFLGGVHWGIGLKQGLDGSRFHFLWGVCPPLLGWVAVVMPAYAGLPLLGLVLVACYLVDRRTWPDAGLAHWLPMRLRLTVVATASCVFGAAGT